MNVPRNAALLFLLVASFSPSLYGADNGYLKEMPKEDEIPAGRVVYVDDGKCRSGEVKEVTGGSRAKATPRTVRCVKRPESDAPK